VRELLEVSERLKATNAILEARIEEQLATLRLAAQMQADLLPKAAPSIEGYEIAGKTIPAQMVGGDYFDFIAMNDSRWAICLADISGKGLPASLLMANLQATIRGQALVSSSASECVDRCNRLLRQSVDMGRYASLFYAILDPGSGALRYCNAGHNPGDRRVVIGSFGGGGIHGTVQGMSPEQLEPRYSRENPVPLSLCGLPRSL
jgi:serine phosphatase RsbU (regulator of sigma subunit)